MKAGTICGKEKIESYKKYAIYQDRDSLYYLCKSGVIIMESYELAVINGKYVELIEKDYR